MFQIYSSFFVRDNAYRIFLVASTLLGFGNSGLGVLSITYIDENVPKHLAPLYIGKWIVVCGSGPGGSRPHNRHRVRHRGKKQPRLGRTAAVE